MELKELNDKINILETSPIRQYLKNNNKISLFEDERVILSDIDKIINTNKENLHNPLKIVVLGEVKSGKSTLVNSLIGKKVSYTNVVEATAAILEIKYSKQEKIIIEQKNQEQINLNSLNELDKLMDSNRNNQNFFDNIKKISIFTDTERLKEITLVDTPGLNTVTSENAERTDSYIVNADVVLWILNSHHLGQSDILGKIEEVLDYGKPIICVLNRIDEVNGDTSEIIAYVQNEMGYMFTEIFATSAKNAWDGYIEKNSLKVKESNINELYSYIVNNIERNAEQVQRDSIFKSMTVQIMRDLYTHKNTKLKIEEMLATFDEDLRELNEFNNTLKQITNNKISEWIDTKFFEAEKQLLLNCGDDKEFINLAKKYSSDEYIHSLINYQYEELNNYILDEWRNNTEQFVKKQIQGELAMTSTVNPYSIISSEPIQNNNDVIEGAKQGGITAGAVGLGLAGYAAWLGPAAAYVSIGSAVSAFFPPLLIMGAIGGAVWKLAGKDKKKVNRYNQIDALVFEIKSAIKNNVISIMKNNLYQASDHYYNNSSLMIISILKQCNISKEQIEKINIELDKYIVTIAYNMPNNELSEQMNINTLFNKIDEKSNYTKECIETEKIYSNRRINTKVVGVTIQNRQEFVKTCYKNQKLTLKRETTNEYDKNAIAIYYDDNKLGYVKKELAFQLAPKMDEGKEFECYVNNVTGGGDYNYGLNIIIDEKIISNNKEYYNSSEYDECDDYDCYEEEYNDYYDDDEYEINRRYDNDPCDADPDMCCGYDH